MSAAHGSIGPRAHELVLGVPGSGKTTLARARVNGSGARRVVYFDPADDFARDGERYSPADLVARPREVLAGTFLRVVVSAGRDPDADVADEFTAVVEACRSVADLGGLVLLADEVGDYSRRADSTLTRLHRNGHHDGVASILVSQCATDIPKTCRRTATRVASLLQVNSDDLDALAREYGDDFASNVKGWRPGRPPVVWTLPTLHAPRSNPERSLA